MTKVQQNLVINQILPLIPKNKRGFASRFNPCHILEAIFHKLKTGCQWSRIFADIEGVKYPFSYQTVYSYYNKWSKLGIFEEVFNIIKERHHEQIDTCCLNLDGTQSLSKKGGEEVGYQMRKKGRTSNILVMTDSKGRPLEFGDVLSGNHNDQYNVVKQVKRMFQGLKACGLSFNKSYLNMDKGFDNQLLRKYCQRLKVIPNVKENIRNRKTTKRGRKRFFDDKIYKSRFVNEQTFAWMDSYRTLLIRFDVLARNWKSWHFLAAALILVKV